MGELIRGAGVGAIGGALGGIPMTILYYALLHDGPNLSMMPAAFVFFGFSGFVVGLIVGPLVFALERRGARVGARHSGLVAGLGALAVGGSIDLIGGLVTGRWHQVGFWTVTLPCLIGSAACVAGMFAKGRRQRLAWAGQQR
jgi:hypothetical protein